MLSVFLDCHGVVYSEFLLEGQTVNKQYYRYIMRCLRENVYWKRPDLWKNSSWILHHDNVPTHTSTLAHNITLFLLSKLPLCGRCFEWVHWSYKTDFLKEAKGHTRKYLYAFFWWLDYLLALVLPSYHTKVLILDLKIVRDTKRLCYKNIIKISVETLKAVMQVTLIKLMVWLKHV